MLESSKKAKNSSNNANLELGAISLKQVSKSFKKKTLAKKGYSSTKTELLKGFRRGKVEGGKIDALKELSINVEPGCSLGIVGRNGSGKSTLLKLISGIYRPDSGSVKVKGKISALIELGAGFHPEFSGRENVYLGGVMYGLSKKEIDEKFDDIVKYAELEDFIDDPVKTYSSGMYMRLGFSLAVHTDPDILLIDEVLAVGDAAFINRCHETISEFRRRKKTMVFVTHDLNSVVRWCDEAIWLQKGEVQKRGEPKPVIDAYLQNVEESEKQTLIEDNDQLAAEAKQDAGQSEKNSEEPGDDDKRWGNLDVEICNVKIVNSQGEDTWLLHSEEKIAIEVEYQINKPVEELVFGIGIIRADGVSIFGTNTAIEDIEVPVPDNQVGVKGTYRFEIERLGLLENSYFLDVAAHKEDGTPYDYHHRTHKFSVRGNQQYHGVFKPVHEWKISANYDSKVKKAC